MTTKKKSTPARAKSRASAKTAPARKKAAPAPAKSSAANGKALGLYTVPRGHVSIAVPPFWTLRQTNDDLEVEAPTSSTSVIVTVFQRTKDSGPLDARDYLQHFLETAPHDGRAKIENGTKARATARYKDPDGDNWNVLFLTNGNTLLLGTCNSSLPATNKEAKTGLSVLDSLTLKRAK